MKTVDTAICPDCEIKLDVDRYGPGKCPKCGCKFTVFRDSVIRVDIETSLLSGTLWISLPEEGER